MDSLSSTWTPSDEENKKIITNVYELINEKLLYLKDQTDCPDEFIYKFLAGIQKEWHPSSCQSIARSKKEI